jgi:sugar phosphate isomerase/epimerase
LFPLWGFEGSLTETLRIAAAAGFDGIELNLGT